MTPKAYAEARKRDGISPTACVREIAAITGACEPAVWHWLNGKRNASDAVCRLLDAWQSLPSPDCSRLLNRWKQGLDSYVVPSGLSAESRALHESILKAMREQNEAAEAAIRQLLADGVPLEDIVVERHSADSLSPARLDETTTFSLPPLTVRVRDKE